MRIDIDQLVGDGYLDLQAIFKASKWEQCKQIAEYTLCCYGESGAEPGQQEVWLEKAEEYGIVAYRWRAIDHVQETDCGGLTLDEAAAIEEGQEYAENNDEAI